MRRADLKTAEMSWRALNAFHSSNANVLHVVRAGAPTAQAIKTIRSMNEIRRMSGIRVLGQRLDASR